TPESRLRELAARPIPEGTKVHAPEDIRRMLSKIPSSTPNSIQETDLSALTRLGRKPDMRQIVMYDNEGRPVQTLRSDFNQGPGSEARRLHDTTVMGSPEHQGQ